MAQKQHFSLRLAPETVRRLVRRSALTGIPKTALAEQLVEEGLRMAEHPGIVFRTGLAGRRPGITGSGLDVWEVVETVHNDGGNTEAAADYLNLAPALVTTAMGYYADYPGEIDQWIELNRAESEEAEAAWRRRQAATRRA